MGTQQDNKNLFTDVEGFEAADELVQKLNARKRGCYKTQPKFFKIYSHILPEFLSYLLNFIVDLCCCIQMNNLYDLLANKFPRELFTNKDKVYEYAGVRVWYDVYLAEEYQYNGEIFIGEQFQINQAEIIGTENLPIEKRIEIHQELLEFLHKGLQLKEAISIIQPKIMALQPPKKEYDRRMI